MYGRWTRTPTQGKEGKQQQEKRVTAESLKEKKADLALQSDEKKVEQAVDASLQKEKPL